MQCCQQRRVCQARDQEEDAREGTSVLAEVIRICTCLGNLNNLERSIVLERRACQKSDSTRIGCQFSRKGACVLSLVCELRLLVLPSCLVAWYCTCNIVSIRDTSKGSPPVNSGVLILLPMGSMTVSVSWLQKVKDTAAQEPK